MKEIIFLAFVFGIILVSGCVQQNEETTPATPSDSQQSGEVKEFEIKAKQFEFVPSTIAVNKGDTVKLHLESIDVAHGFALPDFGVNENLEPGKDVHVEFVADKAGTFTFFCSVPCGEGHSGMNGQLVVK